jgi:hypothetical protein
MKHKKKSWWGHLKNGNLKIWQFTISLNTIATTVLGSGACLLLSYVIRVISINSAYIHSIPKLQRQVANVQAEQKRIRDEYSPPVKPTPVVTPEPKTD